MKFQITIFSCHRVEIIKPLFSIIFHLRFVNLGICVYSTAITTMGLGLELIIFRFILSPSETSTSINVMIFVQVSNI